MKTVNKMKKVLFSNNRAYLKALKKKISDRYILLEAGQGKNINGNMFALLKEIEYKTEWTEFIPFFVVTEETKEKAKIRFDRYQFKKVRLVIRDSKEYQEKLATCKYLITDNSFPTYFEKRENQIYLNTWHGTPLKHLGRSDIRNAISLGNIQKNYFSCDYALFPNEHTRDVFMKDYMLERMFHGKILMADYPRNGALLDVEAGQELRKSLGLEEKQIIAYMPTWRGTGRSANGERQIEIIGRKLKEIDANLRDDQVFFVNLHFLVARDMDFAAYKHIKAFPEEYETYEFLNICDVLVTDYSSVFFDFAAAGKKIILYAYDREEYLRDKGMYMDMFSLPFPVVEDNHGLLEEINSGIKYSDQEFKERFCKYADKDIVQKVLRLLIKGEQGDLAIERPGYKGRRIVYHVGDLKSSVSQELLKCKLNELNEDEKHESILVFEGGIGYKKALFLEKLPRDIFFYSLVKAENKGLRDLFSKFVYNRFSLCKKRFELYVKREKDRLFPGWKVDEISVFLFKNYKYIYIYNQFDCEKKYYEVPYDFIGMKVYKKWFVNIERYIRGNYQETILFDLQDEEEIRSQKKYCSDTRSFLRGLSVRMVGDSVKVKMRLRIESFRKIDFETMRICVADKIYIPDISVNLQNSKRYNVWGGTVTFLLPFKDAEDQELQNKICLLETMASGEVNKIRILYGRFWLFCNRLRPIRIFFDEQRKLTWFFRFPKDTFTLTIREKNVTDTKREREKVILAYLLSKVFFFWKPILLFEKNAGRYEESASAVYEKLVDKGIKNAYFVLDKTYEFRDQIPLKYKKNIIDKYSFKHYLCFFCAKSFVGSESKIHSFELRPISQLVEKKLKQSPHNYVFLQHGVMYMISLDSERRSFFRQTQKRNIVEKTVVSSELEADHFIKLGGYQPENLYLCGLPKFDKNQWDSSADKIVVMITWRPWEYIQSIEDIEQTTYFQMLRKIVESIPAEYRNTLAVLPHPLVEKQMRNENNVLQEYIPPVIKYDDILKETKILITDYSSISYDAFYRGCNIIFCWQEKDECLKEYGENAKLMLTEELAFGNVCYDYAELPGMVADAYVSDQKEEFLGNYKKIVNFHDGHNTDRLIEFMERDHII